MKKYSKLDTTNTQDLYNLIGYNKRYRGSYSRDVIPNKLIPGYYIINLGDSSTNGTHWTLLVISKNSALYIDSYGVIPPQSVIDICKLNNKKLLYSTAKLQSIRTNSCGWFCIALIELIEAGHHLVNILYDFFSPYEETKNEKKLLKYFNDRYVTMKKNKGLNELINRGL